MKNSFLLFLFPLLMAPTSCSTQKSTASSGNQPVEDSTDEAEMNPNNAIGKVVLSKEGCSVKLILENEENICYYPVNLSEKFKVDGAFLQFQKYPSRAPLPSGCESCRTIQVENVVRLKR